MSDKIFGTAVNCIDGRVQEPIIKWLKEKYKLNFVDMITEPGADKAISHWPSNKLRDIKAKEGISIKAHRSKVVALAGHHECAANLVSKEQHMEDIKKGVEIIRSWQLPVEVVGLFVNENWEVEQVV